MKKKQSTAKRLFGYLSKYKAVAAISLLAAAFGVVFSLYIPVMLGRAVDNIVGTGNVDFTALKQILMQVVIFIVLSALLQWLSGVLNNRITVNIVRDLREDAFSKIGTLPLSYIDTHPHGETVGIIITDIDQLSEGLLLGFSQLFSGVCTIIVTLIFMLMLEPVIAVLVVILTPLTLVAARYIAKHTYSYFRTQATVRAEQTGFINEMLGGLKTTKAFSHEKANMDKFDEINDRFEKVSLKALFYSSLANPSTRVINAIIYALVALVGAMLCLKADGFSIGSLTALLYFASHYSKPFNDISVVITELQNAFVCAARVFSLIDEQPETPDKPDAAVLEHAQGNVELKDVSFSYNKNKELIKNLNLSVKPGQRVAIVGPTGSGKTTLINLLMRFYDTDGGEITVDGHDLQSLTRRSLRKNYGMVLQETWLKTGTVRDNITLGRKEATDAEIKDAAKAAYAHNFIKRLPNGYDTVIGEDDLSQGQKQLLCIARVMLSLPPMLILDEATSSIDTRTELRVQDAFARMMRGRTTFVVAHRLSTIRESDLILVLKDGAIIEQGTHDELLAADGFYARLFNSQFSSASD